MLLKSILLFSIFLHSFNIGAGTIMKEDLTKIPLLFIHGFKGSHLVSPDGTTSWLNSYQALGLENTKLQLSMEWNQDKQIEDGLQAKNILDSISLVPYLYKKNIYGTWLDLAKASQRPFYTFAYDWRRDNLESLKKFETLVQEIYKKHQTKIQIVAHSMGGLITFAMLNEFPHFVHDVTFVGVPFRAGISFLQDMTVGTRTGFNSRILDPETLGSFPSVYSLYPLDSTGLLSDQDGRPLKFDFYNADDWMKYKVGLFSSDKNKIEKMTFFIKTLEQAKKFRSLISFKEINYPPITVVNSNQFFTIEKVTVTKHQNSFIWDFKSKQNLCHGDGRVCATNALPPEGVPSTVYTSKYEHSELLDDPEVMKMTIEKTLQN
jgi:pimeloyl-ACP methyl ester carboxylesterase